MPDQPRKLTPEDIARACGVPEELLQLSPEGLDRLYATLQEDLSLAAEEPVRARSALGVLVLYPTYLVLRGALRVYVRRVLLPKLPLEALYDIHARAELELPEGPQREYAQSILQAEVSRRARKGY